MGIYDSHRQLERQVTDLKKKLEQASAATEALAVMKQDQEAKEKELAKLSKVKAENIKLSKANKELEAKVKHLQSTLDALDKLVDEADRKE